MDASGIQWGYNAETTEVNWEKHKISIIKRVNMTYNQQNIGMMKN